MARKEKEKKKERKWLLKKLKIGRALGDLSSYFNLRRLRIEI